MTPESHQLVRESWALLTPDSDALARRFYEHLFELAPHARALFATTDFGAQRQKLVRMLDLLVRTIDDPDAYVPSLAELGRRHVGYGTASADYDAVGAALLNALDDSLGDAFTPAVQQAWMELYRMIAAIMRRAAERAPALLTGEMRAVRPA